MADHEAELVADTRCSIGESPVWHADEHALYWTDIAGRRLWRLAADGALASWQAPEQIGCIARHRDGGWLAAGESRLWRVHFVGDRIDAAPLAAVVHPAQPMRFNDGRCDRQGRFWAATMPEDTARAAPVGAWYRYDGARLARSSLDGFYTGNGLAFSPDGTTMYVADSNARAPRVLAFDYDVETGTPSNGRTFIDIAQYAGRPDGAAVDIEGAYWTCGNDAGLVHRYLPDGRLDRSVRVPVKKPTMCAFGGPHLDTLYVTSMQSPDLPPDAQPLAGGVFAFAAGITGMPEPLFEPRS